MTLLGMQALAHDMRAPLGAIAALAELLQAHADEAQKTRHYAGQLRAACDQLLALAQELLVQPERVKTPCTPAELARRAAGLFGERIVLREEGSCGICVLADERSVQRILVNLLSNAVKYTPDDGRVELETSVRRGASACHIRFIVRDTGIGMGRETLSRLFTPYARGEEAERAGIPGIGLGLCASRELARAMGGDITVHSRLGEGSEFVLSLECPLAEPVQLAGMRFLVAEDNALWQDALCELLAEHGAKVLRAENGEEAVTLFAGSCEGGIDAVLMDVCMPGMDGYAAAASIRRMERADAKAVPIIALTGASHQEAQGRARASGMNACALKPVSMEELSRLLARVKDSC